MEDVLAESGIQQIVNGAVLLTDPGLENVVLQGGRLGELVERRTALVFDANSLYALA